MAKSTPHTADLTAREQVTLHAAGEIETLINVPQLERQAQDDRVIFDLFVRMMLDRIKALNSVVLSVAGGDVGRDTDEMCQLVYGSDADMHAQKPFARA